jgi:hypothetical protein
MGDTTESPKPLSTVGFERRPSLMRGFGWAVPLGICGLFVPYAMLGLETVIQTIGSGKTLPQDAAVLKGLAGDRAPAAMVCSLIFAASAVASFSPSRSIGYVRSFIIMTAYAFVAIVAAIVINMIFFFDDRNPKEAGNPWLWLYLEYQYLRVFPVTFLPGVIAFTYWQIQSGTSPATRVDQPQSSRFARLTCSQCTLVELLLCVALMGICLEFLRPVRSQRRHQLLAEGVLLWHGQPVDGAALEFYPELEGKRFGEPVRSYARTSREGHFYIYTHPKWRKVYPTVGEFAVTIYPAPELVPGHIFAEEPTARAFASLQETPIRVAIMEEERTGIRIDMSEWCSPGVRGDGPLPPSLLREHNGHRTERDGEQ